MIGRTRPVQKRIAICNPAIGIILLAPMLAWAAGDPDVDPPLAELGAVPVPADNPITPEKVELGRLLFFDTKLSGDASVSCSQCHDPKQGWATNEPICRGYPGAITWRNCPTAINSGHLDRLFRHGGAGSLEDQAVTAATGSVEGSGDLFVMEQRLWQTPEYVERFRKVFGTDKPRIEDAWRAIAAFERAELSGIRTPLDEYLAGDANALSAQAVRGLGLFLGKANCIECHNGPLLTDQKNYNLGVPRPPEFAEFGVNTVTFRFMLATNDVPEEYYRSFKDDPGVYLVTREISDAGKFRTAPLRYLLDTAPYMHAGQFYTLEEVVDFYDQGGGENEFTQRFGTKTPILQPLGLSASERADLVRFLEEISGDGVRMATPIVPSYRSGDQRED